MDSKDRWQVLGERKYLQYTDSGLICSRKQAVQALLPLIYAQRGKIFCSISHAAVWEAYCIPGSRAGKQGRQDPCFQQTLHAFGGKGSRWQISRQTINQDLKDYDGVGVGAWLLDLRRPGKVPLASEVPLELTFTEEKEGFMQIHKERAFPVREQQLRSPWGRNTVGVSLREEFQILGQVGSEGKSQFQGCSWEGEGERHVAP